MFYANAFDINGALISKIPVATCDHDGYFVAKIQKESIPYDTYALDFMPEYGNASANETGYMVAPRGGPYSKCTYMMCCFKERDDYEHIINGASIPIFGVKKENETFVAIVTGMRSDYDTVIGVKNGVYYIYPRFTLDGEPAYEDITVRYHFLKDEDANYSGMARTYRNYQLGNGACVPLRERVKTNPYLEYAANSMNVRIRLAMKPVPTPVMEQTLENEPEMVVSCTFDRMKDLINEFERQGVDKAEFCLIGWNLKGHDGRYPQMFPVEPALGGEEKLRELIRYGQNKGYQMTCHSNSSDAYTISSMWNEDDILMKKDGTLSVDDYAWSGGRMYQLCPVAAKKQAEELIPKIADLGFRGIHYIDVITLHPARKCYSSKHPVNRRESVRYNDEIMKLSKKYIGGFSSEGAFDVNIDNLDFALFVHENVLGEQIPICDRVIPLWELVYHGIVLHNTSWETGGYRRSASVANPANEKKRLKNIEFGARPLVYFHMLFHGHADEIDKGYTTATDELMAKSVSDLKIMAEDYEKLSSLQFEFMQNHEMIAPDVFETTYSDGTKVIVDYNAMDYKIVYKS